MSGAGKVGGGDGGGEAGSPSGLNARLRVQNEWVSSREKLISVRHSILIEIGIWVNDEGLGIATWISPRCVRSHIDASDAAVGCHDAHLMAVRARHPQASVAGEPESRGSTRTCEPDLLIVTVGQVSCRPRLYAEDHVRVASEVG